MIIRPHKISLIKKNFIEFSFKKDEDDNEEIIPDFEKFKTLNSAEQYYLADNYNWDDGTIVLDWIIDSPKCDKGTASLIFWRAEPDFYFDFTIETIEEYEKPVWNLLQKIVGKFRENGFKNNRYKFDPIVEGYKTDWKTELDIWEIPAELKTTTKGKKPFVFGL
ncbi:DUF4274 domain-containing protein [Maribacter antarcticus]|uniref:DUF4274 domain-containing protein n=1 Tax=Maribacter antarcticus TaxID=505250 RepID=UPI00047D0855|nr:DUF4274 domain-containing protein [Maribacter antarcticus]